MIAASMAKNKNVNEAYINDVTVDPI